MQVIKVMLGYLLMNYDFEPRTEWPKKIELGETVGELAVGAMGRQASHRQKEDELLMSEADVCIEDLVNVSFVRLALLVSRPALCGMGELTM